MISASTQWPAIGWYSYVEPGGHSRYQRANAARRPALVNASSGGNGACGNPPMCSITCSTVTTSLPLVPNSGTYSATGAPSRTRPDATSSHITADTSGLHAENTAYRVDVVASPNASSATIDPSNPSATWHEGSVPSSISRRHRSRRSFTAWSSIVAITPEGTEGPYGRGARVPIPPRAPSPPRRPPARPLGPVRVRLRRPRGDDAPRRRQLPVLPGRQRLERRRLPA